MQTEYQGLIGWLAARGTCINMKWAEEISFTRSALGMHLGALRGVVRQHPGWFMGSADPTSVTMGTCNPGSTGEGRGGFLLLLMLYLPSIYLWIDFCVFSTLPSQEQKAKAKFQNVLFFCSQWRSHWISPFKTTCCGNSEGRSLGGFFVKFGTKLIPSGKEKRKEQQPPELCSQAWRLLWGQAWRPCLQALHVLCVCLHHASLFYLSA